MKKSMKKGENTKKSTKRSSSTNSRSVKSQTKNDKSTRPAKADRVEAQKDDPKFYVNRVMGTTNDPKWYNRNPGILKDAANISWFNQLGAVVGNFGTSENPYFQVPGIMVFDSITGPGLSYDSVSGPSIAGLATYDRIRRELNKPNPDYEAQDIMMYLLACDDIFAQYINILRAFGIVHTWSGENLYTPKALMKSIYGWSPTTFQEFVKNEANYRAEFNMLIYKASSFLFYPEAFTITDRHAWLCGNIFQDHDSDKAQMYAFRKANYWLFDETSSESGTQLAYYPIKLTDTSMSAMLTTFGNCIEALRSSTLVRTLVADMRQALGDKNILEMGRVDEAFSIYPTYDTNALKQIENMDVLFAWDIIEDSYYESLDVTQDIDTNALIWTPFIQEGDDPGFVAMLMTDRLINIHDNDTSPENVAETTRLMVPILPSVWQGDTGYTFNIASDFVTKISYYNDPTGESEPKELRTLIRDTATLETVQNWIANDLSAWTTFDWAPKLFWLSGSDPSKVLPILEYDKYTVIGAGTDNNSVLQRLNTACNLSMWSVPEFGAWEG